MSIKVEKKHKVVVAVCVRHNPYHLTRNSHFYEPHAVIEHPHKSNSSTRQHPNLADLLHCSYDETESRPSIWHRLHLFEKVFVPASRHKDKHVVTALKLMCSYLVSLSHALSPIILL